MTTPAQIDYDALADQARKSATPKRGTGPAVPAAVDYDALAAQARQTQATPPSPSLPSPKPPSFWDRYNSAVAPYVEQQNLDYRSLLPGKNGQYNAGAYGHALTTLLRDVGAGGLGVVLHPIDTVKGAGKLAWDSTDPRYLVTGKTSSPEIHAMDEALKHHPLETGAQMAGQTAAMGFGAEAIPKVLRAAKAVPESIVRTVTDTGKGPIKRLVEEKQAANTKIDAVNEDRVEAQHRSQAKADADYRSDLLTLHQKYAQSVRDAQQKFAGNKAKVEEANAQALREYNQKVGKVIQDRRAAAATEQARANAAAQTQVVGSQLIYRLNKLNSALRARAGQMYDAVGEKMTGASLPSDTLADIVKAAQDKWIRGSPEKIREFNAMLNTGEPGPELALANQTAQNLGYKDFRAAITNPQMRETLSRALPPDVWQAAVGQGTKPVPWNDLQGFYEETGAKIADGPQPGKADIFKALQQVHDGIGNQMRNLAKTRGADKEFDAARNFYRGYMQVFRTPTGPSASGSVVAQALLAKDPAVAVSKFSAASSNRGISDLNRYDPSLAQLAQHAQAIKQSAPATATARTAPKSIAAVPPPKTAPVPTGANLGLPPVIPEPTTVPLELKPRQTISTPDLVAARRAAAEARAGKVQTRGTWVATWPIFQAMRALWGGRIPSIPAMALESAGTFATIRAAAAMMQYPPMMEFLTKARPEDVALIPPELRGDLPGLVSLAQRQGIKVTPALVAAAAAGTASQHRQPAPAITPAQAIQAMQPAPAPQGAQQ
jgi:hypothetical protein